MTTKEIAARLLVFLRAGQFEEAVYKTANGKIISEQFFT